MGSVTQLDSYRGRTTLDFRPRVQENPEVWHGLDDIDIARYKRGKKDIRPAFPKPNPLTLADYPPSSEWEIVK